MPDKKTEPRPEHATPAEVRAWAKERGLDVGVRGRISSKVTAAYNRGHRRKFLGSPYRTEVAEAA